MRRSIVKIYTVMVLVLLFGMLAMPATAEESGECSHTDINIRYESEYLYEEIMGDNQNHSYIYNQYKQAYCYNCYKYVGEKQPVSEQRWNQLHNYDTNEVCIDCGHVNTCVHQIQENISIRNPEYTEFVDDNVYHRVSGDQYRSVYCTNCRMFFIQNELYQTGVTERQNHRYNEDGVCQNCGHVNSCRHENITPQKQYYDCRYEQIAGNDKNHRIVGGYLKNYGYCMDCRESIPGTDEKIDTFTETRHRFMSGVCTDCGYKNTCTHPSSNEDAMWSNQTVYRDEGNPYTHKATGTCSRRQNCQICGESFVSKIEEVTAEEVLHNFILEGYCIDCGHKNTCSHTNVRESIARNNNYDNITPVETDDATHIISNTILLKQTRCSDCYVLLNIMPIPETVVEENHRFNSGYCSTCGVKNTCTHPYTFIRMNDGAQTSQKDNSMTCMELVGDNKYHMTDSGTYKETICTICHAVVSKQLNPMTGNLRKHNYNQTSARCVDCGHINTCKHDGSVQSQTYYQYATYQQIPGNTGVHLVTGYKCTQKICDLCGSSFQWTADENKTIGAPEPHNYADGVCYYCGLLKNGTAEQVGDINKDGFVTAEDRMLLTRALADKKMQGLDVNLADLDGDNVITNKDRAILARYLANWNGYESLPHYGQ